MSNLDGELVSKVGRIFPRRKRSLCALTGKGGSLGTWKHLEESSANACKDVVEDIKSSRIRRGQIAKGVRALR